ncbi:MAG: RNA polymerase sigma factor [Longimicrobiales bacterium]
MERVRRGEEAALDALLRRYWRPLVAFSLGFVRDLDNAEDVVQEAFVRVWQRRCDWQPNGSVRSYLYRVTRNISLNERRAREVRDRWQTNRLRYPHRSSATPAQQFDAQQLRTPVAQLVTTLRVSF